MHILAVFFSNLVVTQRQNRHHYHCKLRQFCLSVCVSVCLSVRPSHSWTVSKCLKVPGSVLEHCHTAVACAEGIRPVRTKSHQNENVHIQCIRMNKKCFRYEGQFGVQNSIKDNFLKKIIQPTGEGRERERGERNPNCEILLTRMPHSVLRMFKSAQT